jgi:pimeloyl-ACP methyl ester carboxylesterase
LADWLTAAMPQEPAQIGDDMGSRTGVGSTGSQPNKRKKQRSLFGTLVRVAAWIVVVGALLFVAAGFYYSGEIRDGALLPAESYDNDYDLSISDVSGDRISITDTGSDGQIGEPGPEGIEWEDGYVTTSDLIASGKTDSGDRTDVRQMIAPDLAPEVGTAARLDSFTFAGDPDQAFGIPFETVRYRSDIDSFPAWYIEGGSDTWAIFVHGRNADLTESLRIIPILHALDYPILVIHYRNDPGETKDPSGYHQFGATEWVDIAGAVRYAEANGSTSHILVGYSMGGAIVTSYLTQSPLRNRTLAAILDSPVFDFEATVDFQAAHTELPLIGVTIPQELTTFAKWIASWRFDIDWEATDYIAKSPELHAPMLVFHGTNDTLVPLATSETMARLRPEITTLIETDASHTKSWNVGPEAYASAITEFLAEQSG